MQKRGEGRLGIGFRFLVKSWELGFRGLKFVVQVWSISHFYTQTILISAQTVQSYLRAGIDKNQINHTNHINQGSDNHIHQSSANHIIQGSDKSISPPS